MDTSTELFTGDKRIPYTVGWSRLGNVYFIKSTQPTPMSVLAVVSKLEIVDD